MSEIKACPKCGEQILAVAKKCRHCKSDLGASGHDFGRLVGAGCLVVVGAFALLAVFTWLGRETPVSSSGGPAIVHMSGVTLAAYQQLQTGMTYAQAVQTLGAPGTEMSRSEMAGFTTVMYSWEGREFASNMNAMFQNDKLVNKAQFGLR